MGKLWDLIQGHMDSQRYPVSERQVARALGVSPTTIRNWKHAGVLPSRENLVGIARLVGVPYNTALEAALIDAHYREEGEDRGDASPITAAEWDERAAALQTGARPLSDAEVVSTLGPRPTRPGEVLGGRSSEDAGHTGVAPRRRSVV